MTAQEEQDLREWSAELAGAERSPWEPRCVAQAFCSGAADEALVFTMQVWIDLEAVRSPFLLGQMPEAEVAYARFAEAIRAFGHPSPTPEACTGEELVSVGQQIIRVIGQAFAMRLRLAPPEGMVSQAAADNGAGDWLPVVACLKSQLGFSLADALALPVGQAFALIVGHRCNQGWSVAGETYVSRDAADEPEGLS